MDPEAFIEALANNKIHPYKLKGSGPLNFHLGCAFKRDDNGTLYQDASKYAERMKDNYKTLCSQESDHPIESIANRLIQMITPNLILVLSVTKTTKKSISH